MSSAASERLLTLPYECLETLPSRLREVRVYADELTDSLRVGKRLDLTVLDESANLLEPALMQAIDHPNVVPVYAAAAVSDYPPPMKVIEIVMPYYPRGSITDAFARGERFTLRQAVRLAQAGLMGLAEMHEGHGLLHRDVKGSNFLLTDDSSLLKVADLGLAGRMDEFGCTAMIDAPQMYSPPEMVATGVLTRASDLYSMGLVLQELAAGPFPYEEYTTTEIAARLMRGVHPIRSRDLRLPPWVPRNLRRVIAKATARSVPQRFQSARAMSDALAKTRVVDWQETSDMRWEAPYVHHPARRVAVEGRTLRSGQIRLSLLTRQRAWRRAVPDVDVPDLYALAAVQVFDQATSIASHR